MPDRNASRMALGTAYMRAAHQLLDAPAFFSWLGVTMYLEESAIDATLRSVAAFPPGSGIVLTFTSPRGGSPSPLEERAASHGEPWVSYFTTDMIEAKLRGAGFSSVEFLAPDAAEERYYKQRPGDLPVPKRTGIACAVI